MILAVLGAGVVGQRATWSLSSGTFNLLVS